ncbi:MAG TPA: helix-turn-helix domain-containing protein [Jiangellaceae bacterium]
MDDRPAVSVALVAVQESYVSCLTGLYDTLELAGTEIAPGPGGFEVEIVALTDPLESCTSRFPIVPHRTIDEVPQADVVILPAALADSWEPGSHPQVLSWIRSLHEQGSVVCSVCSGGLLLAETGLLDGHRATSHWNEAERFRTHFPKVRLDLTKELVVADDDQRLVTSGASAAWHDLALYLISRYRGPEVAQAVARFFMLQWHTDGQTPYLRFEPNRRHGDAAVLRAQEWIERHWADPDVLADLPTAADLTERTFTRRFRQATGHSPSGYLQHKRVDEAKTLLERTDRSVERICWTVGYDDPASFRRLFKRLTAVTPGTYRRKFTGQ